MFSWRVLILLLCLAQSGFGTELWVAPNGNDANPGTRSKPFASLEAARNAARRLKPAGHVSGKSGTTIFLRGGDYVRTHALELEALDSGQGLRAPKRES